eukprot:scaffold1626_cov178-Alexandrium_tamarense.AAC.6
MGRITIFSIEECSFCRRLKAALTARSIPYTDINISHYPQKRADMLSLTDRLTVPQVFFNEEHAGGAEETLELLKKWDEEIARDGKPNETPYTRYVDQIESVAGPYDTRLAPPTGPPAIQNMHLTITRPKEIIEINGKHYTTLQLMKELVLKMPREDLSSWGVVYYDVFRGTDAVTALRDIFQLNTREEATQLGMKLQRKEYIKHEASKGDHTFGDNRFLFRLRPFHTPNVLNSFCAWKHPVENEPINVLFDLNKLWGKLEARHVNKEGLVDHTAIRRDDYYWKFEEDVCEVQNIELKGMGGKTKIAFVSVLVGGHVFSFNDLEHGMLRANARPPYRIARPFSVMDERRHLALDPSLVDCRIHFGLNCGAKSCPPVKKYTVEALDEELRLAAMAFCEQEENVSIDDSSGVCCLHPYCHFLRFATASSKDELLSKISTFLRGDKKATLDNLIQNGRVSVEFMQYDWSTNDCNTIVFEKGSRPSKAYEIDRAYVA